MYDMSATLAVVDTIPIRNRTLSTSFTIAIRFNLKTKVFKIFSLSSLLTNTIKYPAITLVSQSMPPISFMHH